MTVEVRQITDSWNGRDRRVVAAIGPVRDELTERLGLTWVQDSDNLDYYEYVLLESPSGRVFGLRRYPRNPVPSIEIIVDVDRGSAADLLDEALATVGLAHADVIWRSPDVDPRTPS